VLVQDADMDMTRATSQAAGADCGMASGCGVRFRGFWAAASRALFLALRCQQALTFAFSIFHQPELTDMETCYKVFRREVLKDIR